MSIIEIPRAKDLTTAIFSKCVSSITTLATSVCEQYDSYEASTPFFPSNSSGELKTSTVAELRSGDMQRNCIGAQVNIHPASNDGYRMGVDLFQCRDNGYFMVSLWGSKFMSYEEAFSAKREIEKRLAW